MADNVAITAGTGTAIAADDVSSVFYQKIKLDGGGDGVSAPITGDTANGLDVDVTRLPALPAGDNNIGNVDIVTLPTVELKAGTATIGKLAANSGVDIGDVDVVSLPALPAGTNNIGVVTPYALPANIVQGCTAKIEDTNSTSIIAADGALRIYLTSIIVTNSDATVGTLVTIQDDNVTPVKLCHGYCAPAGGGFALTFPVPPRTTAAKALCAICGTTSAEVYVSAVGFLAA